MKQKFSDRIIALISFLVVGIFGLLCLYPILLTISVSFSDNYLVQIHGYKLIPEKFSADTYVYIFTTNAKNIFNAYKVTIFVTIAGTLLAMLVTSMMAFALSIRSLKYRNGISLFSYFTVIFSAGIVPWYIVCINILHLKDSIFALILPYSVNVFYLFLLRNYFQSIPDSIFESAKIDGANYFYIYYKIAVPLAKTALLTVGLLYSLSFWNDWWLAIMLITKKKLFPLQYYLYNIMSNVQALQQGVATSHITLPTETAKMATTCITIGPIIFLYPFVQKYFVKGITIGAVKG
jgi:putative aldouronate transport system permease protein